MRTSADPTTTTDNRIILCGGYYTPRDCVTLDTDLGTWSKQKLELKHDRNQHLALDTPEGLLLMGGQEQGHSQELLHLDPKTEVGLTLPRLPQEIAKSCAGKYLSHVLHDGNWRYFRLAECSGNVHQRWGTKHRI